MKLYHVTATENMESIKECGLEPQVSDKLSNSAERIDEAGIFGFVDEDSAYDFGRDNFGDFVIVTFIAEENNTVNDPEYDGEAKFYQTNDNVKIVDIIE